MIWRKMGNIVVAATAFAWMGALALAADAVAAHVVRLSHPAAKYTILRDNRSLPITFNMSLRNGDVIVVGDPVATLGIRYVDHSAIDITKATSPYKVMSKATKPEVTSNFLLALWQNVTKAQSAGLRSTSTRDTDGSFNAALDSERQTLAIRIPGLADSTARIAAGPRHFMMRWSGGRAPYRVTVRSADGTVLIDEADIPSKVLALRSRTVAFAPGRYTLEITDGTNASVKGGFVAESGLSLSADANAGEDAAEDATNAAALLAAGDDKTLYYESYLRLYGALGAQFDPAVALAAWLANGAVKE